MFAISTTTTTPVDDDDGSETAAQRLRRFRLVGRSARHWRLRAPQGRAEEPFCQSRATRDCPRFGLRRFSPPPPAAKRPLRDIAAPLPQSPSLLAVRLRYTGTLPGKRKTVTGYGTVVFATSRVSDDCTKISHCKAVNFHSGRYTISFLNHCMLPRYAPTKKKLRNLQVIKFTPTYIIFATKQKSFIYTDLSSDHTHAYSISSYA